MHIKDSASKQTCDVFNAFILMLKYHYNGKKAQSSLVEERGAHEGLVSNGRIGD